MNAGFAPTSIAALALLALTTLCPSPALARQAESPEITIVGDACRWQAKTHAQVVGYRLGDEKLFDGVVVFNGGTSNLVEVQIGCVLEATLPGDTRPTRLAVLTMEPVTVEIPNGTVGPVPVPWPTQSIIAILIGLFTDPGSVEVTARLGVTRATWADGSRFALRNMNRFRERPNAALDAAYANVTEAELTAAIEAFGLSGDTPAPERTRLRICRSVPGWVCAVSTVTSECTGSAMCPFPALCSSKCVTVILP